MPSEGTQTSSSDTTANPRIRDNRAPDGCEERSSRQGPGSGTRGSVRARPTSGSMTGTSLVGLPGGRINPREWHIFASDFDTAGSPRSRRRSTTATTIAAGRPSSTSAVRNARTAGGDAGRSNRGHVGGEPEYDWCRPRGSFCRSCGPVALGIMTNADDVPLRNLRDCASGP